MRDIFWNIVTWLRSVSVNKKCTCDSDDSDRHYLSCDLMYTSNSYPRKKKVLGIFYPMKELH